MIPLKTILTPRSKDDEPVEIGGVEGTAYTVKPLVFGETRRLTCDEISQKYDTSGYAVFIDLESEADLWRRFSTERFDRGNKAGDRRARQQAAEPSPEMVFRAEAERNAKK
jgi:hypothetical protein